jgi:uncharacterized protein YbaR (Trm112 family)
MSVNVCWTCPACRHENLKNLDPWEHESEANWASDAVLADFCRNCRNWFEVSLNVTVEPLDRPTLSPEEAAEIEREMKKQDS